MQTWDERYVEPVDVLDVTFDAEVLQSSVPVFLDC
jgi:hypothetical protein